MLTAIARLPKFWHIRLAPKSSIPCTVCVRAESIYSDLSMLSVLCKFRNIVFRAHVLTNSFVVNVVGLFIRNSCSERRCTEKCGANVRSASRFGLVGAATSELRRWRFYFDDGVWVFMLGEGGTA